MAGSTGRSVTRVLMELRPCFDGFTGISQETRTLFSSFHDLPGIRPTGLINHSVRHLARSSPGRRSPAGPATAYDRMSKLIVSSEIDRPATVLGAAALGTARARSVVRLGAATLAGVDVPIHPVSSDRFGDYIWQRLFDKGLPPTEFERITSAEYVSTRPPWLTMHTMGALRRYPRLDTRGFDIFLAQTPWPSHVAPGTELLVRYHDAIPMFHPHQIKWPAMHQFHHSSALRANAVHASFVCQSEATRDDLLTLHPDVEARTAVVPISISPSYYPEPIDAGQVIEIVRSRLHDDARHLTQSTPGGDDPVDAITRPDTEFRYLLMVSTIEPRKNHIRLIEAWERIRRTHDPDLHLVIVGSPGWGHESTMQRIGSAERRGGLFHLSGVPTDDLRALYSNALATVCPSVAEGFDMSAVEAMSCGSPVIASDIAAHRETCADAATYVSPYDSEQLATAIEAVNGAPDACGRRQTMIAAGFERSRRYQQAVVAERWSELFDDIAAGRFGARRTAR
jgi:glycosyltransferase involved in cell wall biosynthesis